MSKGKFIVFEGIDGSGKSTQVRLLSEKLKAAGIPCAVTKEPTDSPIGSLVHNIMTGRIQTDGRATAALFAADRIDHLTNAADGIVQLIEKGVTVICDRYYFSSYAYQSTENDAERVIALNAVCAEILRPDINFFIDVPVKTAAERISAGRVSREIYETEERLSAVRENYFAMFERFKDTENVEIIDGTLTAEEISQKILLIMRNEE